MKYILIIILLVGCQKDRHTITFKFHTIGEGAISINGKLNHVIENKTFDTKFEFETWHKRKYAIKATNSNKTPLRVMQYYVYLNGVQIDNDKFEVKENETFEKTRTY